MAAVGPACKRVAVQPVHCDAAGALQSSATAHGQFADALGVCLLFIPVQALTPLTIGRGRAAASALGALWGFGHSTGQLILGLVFVLLKVRAYFKQ